MIKFSIPVAQRYVLFICTVLFCCVIASFVAYFISRNGMSPAKINVMMVMQDLIMFILPALVTAMLITRTPADFLQINRGLDLRTALLTVLLLVVSVPAMNVVVEWNASLHLPDSLASLEQWMRQSEESAARSVDMLMSGSKVMSLVVCVLTVGLLAGFSEELIFRGTLQRLMVTSGVKVHIAVWVTAIIFSAVHFQFFGFVPRMLLGALFGYLVVWSGSLWIGVLAHATNNIFAALALWTAKFASAGIDVDKIGSRGSATDLWIVIASIVFSVIILRAIYIRTRGTRTINKAAE